MKTEIRFDRRMLVGLALGLVLLPAVAGATTTITIMNNDGPGEGFNDMTPAAPVTGNPGTTLGQQRLNVFQAAADAWEAILDSSVEILVQAQFDVLSCGPLSGVLGGATTISVFRDAPGLPRSSTWYPGALADSLTGTDLDPGLADIFSQFNSAVDTDPNCLTGLTWWYGIGAPPAPSTLDFFTTVFHELGHGLGFQTFVDRQTGEKFPCNPSDPFSAGCDDTYMLNLENHSTGELWPSMTNGERVASIVDTGDLHWVGPNAVAQSGVLSSGTHASGHIQMYAPNPVQLGSSTSHWDTALFPDEVMEPFLTDGAQDLVTTELMQDIGWQLKTGGGGPCSADATTLCLPGNDRFKVTLFFDTVQGPGNSGDAQAISLNSLGITKGGILHFGDSGNPEVLVKVLDGCGINNRWWVFYAATTNVGFELTVEDTVANLTKVYTNPDIHPADTITDTQAFATCP